MKIGVALERVAIGVSSVVLSVVLVALLSGYFAGKDQAGVSGPATLIGQQFRDLGHAHLPPGQPHPAYDSSPPTSGAHVPEPIRADQTRINDDQLLQALETGNVVIVYGERRPPAGLVAFARHLSGGAFSASLAAAGQAVILARRPGTTGLIGLAWAHLVHVSAVNDVLLRDFVEYWLGRGAPSH